MIILFLVLIVFLYLIYKKINPSTAITGDSTQIAIQLNELKNQVKQIEERREKEEKLRSELSKKDAEKLNLFMDGTKKSMDEYNNRIMLMHKCIEDFQRTIHGTKSRGQVGEQALKEVLKASIQSRQVETNLAIDGNVVEFAWKLSGGKFIPVDAKLPEVELLMKQFEDEVNVAEKKKTGKQIVLKIEKEIKNITKYQNSSKTTDKCVLVIPQGILDLFPELIDEGAKVGVIICSFETVYIHLFLLTKEHELFTERGDLGKYQKIVEKYQQIVNQIQEKSETIERGITMVDSANDSIKESVRKSKSLGDNDRVQ